MGCQYFNNDWKLPSLNNVPPSRADMARESLLRQEYQERVGKYPGVVYGVWDNLQRKYSFWGRSRLYVGFVLAITLITFVTFTYF